MNVTEKDLIGGLTGFPIEVVEAMLAEQFAQGCPLNVKVFQENPTASKSGGGFNWDGTRDGWDFWHDVIDNQDFELFRRVFGGREVSKPIVIASNRVPSRRLPKTMTKLERWIFSKINSKELGRYAKLRALKNEIDASCCSLWSFLIDARTPNVFDYLLAPHSQSDIADVFPWCIDGSRYGRAADIVGDAVCGFLNLYENLMEYPLGSKFSGNIFCYGDEQAMRCVLGWIKKNVDIAIRFDRMCFRFDILRLYVTHIGAVGNESAFEMDEDLRFKHNGELYVIDGEVFRISL